MTKVTKHQEEIFLLCTIKIICVIRSDGFLLLPIRSVKWREKNATNEIARGDIYRKSEEEERTNSFIEVVQFEFFMPFVIIK